MRLELDPALCEAAVQEALRRLEGSGRPGFSLEHRRAVNRIYDLPAETREPAFARVHLDLFQQLGFERALVAALEESAEVRAGVARVIVLSATTRQTEDVDLEPGTSPAETTLRLRLAASRFQELDDLLAYLRRQLVHMADLLDAGFAFVREPIAARPAEDMLIRGRYRTLWGVTVGGRLARAGRVDPAREREAARAELLAAYATMAEVDRERVLARLFDGVRPDHRTLLACARETRKLLELAGVDPARATRFAPGQPCPLCRFPSHHWRTEMLPPAALAAISRHFPSWSPEDGLCERCSDIYEMSSAPDFAPAKVRP